MDRLATREELLKFCSRIRKKKKYVNMKSSIELYFRLLSKYFLNGYIH